MRLSASVCYWQLFTAWWKINEGQHKVKFCSCSAIISSLTAWSVLSFLMSGHVFGCLVIYLDKLNTLWTGDAMWHNRTGSTLAQVMACCLTALNHNMYQCWLIISKVQWKPLDGFFTRHTPAINYYNYLEINLSQISFKSPRGQWVTSISNLNILVRLLLILKKKVYIQIQIK